MKKHLLFPLFILWCLPAAPLGAASPVLNGIMPRGAQRGTEAVLFFNGGRLADAREILFYDPGIVVTRLEVVNDSQVKATVKIAVDCQLGEHGMRLRTAGGITEFRTFFIGNLPILEEKEPNSDWTSPQKIPLNVTIHGVIDNEDVDYFLVEGKKGQRLSVEIEAMRLGDTMFDPYVAILDAKRFELAACDDSPLLGQDACCSTVLPADGSYLIQVRDSAYGGNGACRYRLHVGTFPRPTAVVPAGGKLGEELEVTFLGDPTGPIKQKVKLPVIPPAGKFGLFAQDADGIAPSPVTFRLSPFGNVIETKDNQSPQTATPVSTLPSALNGVIGARGEVDFYRFPAKKGQTFDVHCYARRLGSPLDPVMAIAPANGNPLVGNDDAVGPDSYFRFTVPADGDYILTVKDHLDMGGPTYFYRVEFTPVQPQLSLTFPKVDIFGYSQERQTITVPRGNRYACLVIANRTDFGGDLVLGAEGLPAGLKMLADPMPAGLNSFPVVFEATADAPVAGNLAHLIGSHADPKMKIQGGFEQSIILVGIGNQGVYWKNDVNRAAIAVGEAVPFKVAIVEPKIPLVQNGAMNLKIVAERQAGFKGPITIYPLFNPPGVSSAGSATIAEGKNETTLALNAAPGAQVGKWKITVLAVADAGKGPLWISSQLAQLEVAPPYVAFAMERTAGEQGKSTDLFCKIAHHTPFQGSALAKVMGLPAKVTAPDVQITKDSREAVFKLTIDKTSPPGQHNNIFCQVLVPLQGEMVLHNVGGTQVRIDVPLPPKPNEKPKPAVVAQPAQPAQSTARRLSRLEKLRLEQAEREKAQSAGSSKK